MDLPTGCEPNAIGGERVHQMCEVYLYSWQQQAASRTAYRWYDNRNMIRLTMSETHWCQQLRCARPRLPYIVVGFQCEFLLPLKTTAKKFDQRIDLGLVECAVQRDFCKLEVCSRAEREPRPLVYRRVWLLLETTVIRKMLGGRRSAAVRMILRAYIIKLRCDRREV